ncbi:MAG: hypothetical protein ACYS22_13085 [Planctomycetota bacterium]|jgi:hypothetical protein
MSALIRTEMYVSSAGAEEPLGEKYDRYGTGFAYKGKLVTAKSVVMPHLFDAELRGVEKLLKAEGRKVVPKYTVWAYVPSKKAYLPLYTTKAGKVSVGKTSPDVMQSQTVKKKIEFNFNTQVVEVQLHDPQRGNLAVLAIKGTAPNGLDGGTGATDPTIAIGMSPEGKGDAVIPLPSEVKGDVQSAGAFKQLNMSSQAPPSLAGSPVLNLNRQAIGIVVATKQSSLIYAPIAELDKLVR